MTSRADRRAERIAILARISREADDAAGLARLAFYEAIRDERAREEDDRLSLRQIAREAKLSYARINQIERGL